MLPEYKLALKNLSFNLHKDVNFQEETGRTSSIEFSNNNLSIYDVYNFYDRMDVAPHNFTSDVKDKYMRFWGPPYSLNATEKSYDYIGYENLQRHKESVVKAMLVALLTNNGKRSISLNNDSLDDRRFIFFNCLMEEQNRNTSKRPWNSWRDTHTTLNTLSSASKTNGVVTITTSSAHGLDTQYDDWGAVITTGNANFDISSTDYPNGVPIKIINTTTFTYKKSGSDVSSTSISGSADIKIGWGGSSNNLHLYFN